MLDLNELRVRLDQMTERIVSRLKDRSRFPLNETVYRPDAVPIVGREHHPAPLALDSRERHETRKRRAVAERVPASGVTAVTSPLIV